MGHGNDTGKQIVTQNVGNADTTLANGPSSVVNPLIQKRVEKASSDLDQIDAGNFAGLPLVQAVNDAANRMRSYTPKPSGSAALSANAGGAGGGYADQEAAYNKRLLNDQVGNATVGAVQAERNNAIGTLFPGSAQLDQFDLQKAATYGGLAGQGNALYNTQQNNSFWSNLSKSFGQGLGQNLSGANAGGGFV